jgi:HD-GYP domain-containing protein (c-di-GMP phosphodiesterase class II)
MEVRLSAQRPYREALGRDEVLGLMSRDAGAKLDPEAFEALRTLLTDPGAIDLAA